MSKMNVIYGKSRATKRLADGRIQEIWYQTSIDLDKLTLLARKAVDTKGQRSTDGPLEVRILEVRCPEVACP